MQSRRRERGKGRVLARLFEITQDILRAHEIEPALESIAHGLRELYGWKYVSIVAADQPGGEMYRRVLLGFTRRVTKERLSEHIPRAATRELLNPEFEVLPNCFYMPAEREQHWGYNIYTGKLPATAHRENGRWHERDALCLVLPDPAGEMLGYISLDGPRKGRVPSEETLREMQLFVNLTGLALTNARAHAAEIERRRILEQTSRAQSDFFTVVAHEIRSPLAALRGATVLLNAHFDSLAPERRIELLGVVRSSTTRLSSIFEDILLLSRMDSGRLTLRFEDVDPETLAAESITRLKNEHPHRRFEIVTTAPVPAVRADEGRVVQILINLLSNAVKYSFPDTPIRVALSRENEQCVSFSVENQGVGIADADRERLFTRFGKAGAADDSVGLGLYICSELVSLMGGSIGFESEPNKTTTFHFSLPSAEAAAATA